MIKRTVVDNNNNNSVVANVSTVSSSLKPVDPIIDSLVNKDLEGQYENYNRLQKKQLKNNLNNLYKDFQYFSVKKNNEQDDIQNIPYGINCSNTQFKIQPNDNNLSTSLYIDKQCNIANYLKVGCKFQPKIFGDLQSVQYSELLSMFNEDYVFGNFNVDINNENFGKLQYHYNNDNIVYFFDNKNLYNVEILSYLKHKPFIWKAAQGFSIGIKHSYDNFEIFSKTSVGAILQKVIQINTKKVVDVIADDNEQHIVYNYLPKINTILTVEEIKNNVLEVQSIWEKIDNNKKIKHTLVLNKYKSILQQTVPEFVTQSIIIYDSILFDNNQFEPFVIPNKYIGQDYDEAFINNLLLQSSSTSTSPSSSVPDDKKISIYNNGVAQFQQNSNVQIDFTSPFYKLLKMQPPFVVDILFKPNKDPKNMDSIWPRLFEIRNNNKNIVGNLLFNETNTNNYGKPVIQYLKPNNEFVSQSIFSDYRYVYDDYSLKFYLLSGSSTSSAELKQYLTDNVMYKPMFWAIKCGYFIGFNNNTFDENKKGKLFVDIGSGIEPIGSFNSVGNVFSYKDEIQKMKNMGLLNQNFSTSHNNGFSISSDFEFEQDKWYIARIGITQQSNPPDNVYTQLFLNIFSIDNNANIILKDSVQKQIEGFQRSFWSYLSPEKNWGFALDQYGRTQSINLDFLRNTLPEDRKIEFTLNNVLQYKPEYNFYSLSGLTWVANETEFEKYIRNIFGINKQQTLIREQIEPYQTGQTPVGMHPETFLNKLTIDVRYRAENLTESIHIFKTEPSVINSPPILIGANTDKPYNNDLSDFDIAEYKFYTFDNNDQFVNFVNNEETINKEYKQLENNNNDNLLYRFSIDENGVLKDKKENNLELQGNYQVNTDNIFEPLFVTESVYNNTTMNAT